MLASRKGVAQMNDKIFLATYPDGKEKVLDEGEIAEEQFVLGRWVDFGDPSVSNADFGDWQAEEID